MWFLRLGNQPAVPVTGFLDPTKGRDHASRHFLDPKERWEDLRPVRVPAEYRASLHEPSLDAATTAAVLDDATNDYVAVVKRGTTGQLLSRVLLGTRMNEGELRSRHQVLSGASQLGIYFGFAFRPGSVSHLTTAYRPYPGVVRGPLRTQDFYQAALRKLQLSAGEYR
jgi:hypothetical protein